MCWAGMVEKCKIDWPKSSWTAALFAMCPGPESGGEWNSIQLTPAHEWNSPGFSVGASPV